MRRFLVLALVATLGLACAPGGEEGDPGPFDGLEGPYLGQTLPGVTPEIFAPGMLSTGRVEWSPAFTPDGLELFYTLQGLDAFHLVTIRHRGGRWMEPELVSFTSPFNDADPSLSPDGLSLFFWSNRPVEPGGEAGADADIWMVDREGEGWGAPRRLREEINTDTWQVFPTVSVDRTLYFAAYYEDGLGHFDLWRSDWTHGTYSPPVNLGPAVNSASLDQEPAISPDGNILVFASTRHGREDWDLYVSFRDSSGSWTEARSLGEGFNTEAMDQAPLFSSDGRLLFFSSNRRWTSPGREGSGLTYDSVVEALEGPGNGSADVYWVDARALDAFRPSGSGSPAP